MPLVMTIIIMTQMVSTCCNKISDTIASEVGLMIWMELKRGFQMFCWLVDIGKDENGVRTHESTIPVIVVISVSVSVFAS